MTTRPLGVVDIVYARRGDVVEQSRAAAADGYAHIDPLLGVDESTLALPIGCPTSFPKPADVWCSTPAERRDRRLVGPRGAMVARRTAGCSNPGPAQS